jgi:hypothetical protein
MGWKGTKGKKYPQILNAVCSMAVPLKSKHKRNLHLNFSFLFNLLHVPLLEVILHALIYIYSYNTTLSSSYMHCYILWWLNYLNILMSLVSLSK